MAYNTTKTNKNGIVRDETNTTKIYAEDWNDLVEVVDTNINPYVVVSQDEDGDFNGTDSATIQTAINSISLTGGIVFIKKGTYTFDTNLTIYGNTILMGEGDATILSKTGTGVTISPITGADNITIKDFFIDCTPVKDEIVSSRPINFGINGEHDNIVIDNIHFQNNPDRCIFLDGRENVVQNCYIENCLAGIGTNSHHDDTSTYWSYSIINNRLTNVDMNTADPDEYGEGIDINTHSVGKAYISGNTIIGFREEGIEANTSEVIITDNFVEMVATETRGSMGINANVADKNIMSIVTNNVVTNVGENMIGLRCSSGKGMLISQNRVKGVTGATDSIGIYVSSATDQQVNVSHNFLWNLNIGIGKDTKGIDTIMMGNQYKDCTTNVDNYTRDIAFVEIDNANSTLAGITTKELGQTGDKHNFVILLNKWKGGADHVIGRIMTGRRASSNMYTDIIDVTSVSISSTQHNGFFNITESRQNSIRNWNLVTCLYNGVSYVALQYTATSDSTGPNNFVKFQGVYISTGSDGLTLVPYYNITTSTVVDSEINDSITAFVSTNTPITNIGMEIQSNSKPIPTIASGTIAPISTPTKVGDIFVDTTAGNIYVSKGTSSSADWVQVNN